MAQKWQRTEIERERAHARKEKKCFEIYTIDIEQHYNRYIYNVGVRTTE